MEDLCWNEIMILYQLGEFQNAYDKALAFKEAYPKEERIDPEIAFLSMKLTQQQGTGEGE